MALNNGLVEGYIIDPSKPWCNPFAISEPSFTKKVRIYIDDGNGKLSMATNNNGIGTNSNGNGIGTNINKNGNK